MPLPADIHKDKQSSSGAPAADVDRKTILIYSPDLNFSFSLSMVFQDRYHVVTASNTGMLESFASTYAVDLAIVDSVPSELIVRQIDALKTLRCGLPVIMTYVYDARDVGLDTAVRGHVEAVLYKPFEVETVLSRVEQLLRD